jgi:predicted MFS family arabinose efflux permease
MTQPLLAGIVTQLGGKRAGQAMGLNVFILFTGFGVGSLLFGAVVPFGFGVAFATFSSAQIALGLTAVFLFRTETTSKRVSSTI